MTAQELLKFIDDYKSNMVQFRYTKKHPIKGKRILERIKRK